MRAQYLKQDHLLPGQMVSVGQYISRAQGRLYHTKGKSESLICSQEDVYVLTMPVDM